MLYQLCLWYLIGHSGAKAIVADDGYGGQTLRHQAGFDEQLITVADAGYQVWRPDFMAPDGFNKQLITDVPRVS